jgi:1,4-alpha-glucan branching enzyme
MGRRRVHSMPFGAEVGPDGMVRFRVWAPSQDQVRLALDGQAQEMLMGRLEAGWHELVTGSACVGARYQFVLPNGSRVPDPASRFQPDDVHGPSEVIDPQAYAWEDADWSSLEELSSSRTFLTVVQAFARERAKNRSALAR